MPRRSAAAPAAPPPVNIVNVGSPAPQQELLPPERVVEKNNPEELPTWFWDKINAVPENEWGQVYDLLLYRRGESKVTMAPGEKGFLDQFVRPTSLMEIRKQYGGGLYSITLRKRGKYETTHNFEIEGKPVYSSREQAPNAAPAASGEASLMGQFISVLREELERSRENGGGQGVETAIGMMKEASSAALEVVKQQAAGSGDSEKMITQFTALANAMKAIMPAPAVAGGSNGNLIETIRALKELGLISTPAAATAAADPLANFERMFTVFDRMNEFRGEGGSGRGGGGWKDGLLNMARENLPKVLDIVKTAQQRQGLTPSPGVAGARWNPRESGWGVPPAQFDGPTPAMPGATIEQPGTASPAPNVAPAPQGGPDGLLPTVPLANGADGRFPQTPFMGGDQPSSAPPAGMMAESQYNETLKRHIVEMIYMGASGGTIVDYIEGLQPAMLTTIEMASNEQIKQTFALDPILAVAVENPRFDQVLAEVRGAIADIKADDGDGA